MKNMNVDVQEQKRNVVPFLSNKSTSPCLVVSLSMSQERMKQLEEFVQEGMVKGVDYGLIDGYSKPTLLKPGAEKLCDIFGFSKSVDVINRIEDWENGVFAYEVKMTLTQKENSIVEAEGIGCCNSKEVSFRQQDPYTIVNTILKMAKKRALIDAVLSATRASGLFTQDIEDFPKQNCMKESDAVATKAQLRKIFQIVADINMHPHAAKEMMQMKYDVKHSTQLTKIQASDFIEDLLLLKEVVEEVKIVEV